MFQFQLFSGAFFWAASPQDIPVWRLYLPGGLLILKHKEESEAQQRRHNDVGWEMMSHAPPPLHVSDRPLGDVHFNRDQPCECARSSNWSSPALQTGLHPVFTWSSPGLHLVFTRSSPGLHPVFTRSSPGLHPVFTWSSPGLQ